MDGFQGGGGKRSCIAVACCWLRPLHNVHPNFKARMPAAGPNPMRLLFGLLA